MNWFWIALVGPALWSVSNHLDKYLISRYFKNAGVGPLIIFSCLIGLLVLPLIAIFQPEAVHIGFRQGVLAIIAEMFYLAGILLYFYALQQDEASVVVPMFQVMPVFLFILGYFVLGETLSTTQILGSLLVIAGSVSISLNLAEEKIRFKTKIFWLMMGASLLPAIGILIFKVAALESEFWKTAFWGYVGDVAVGLALLAFVKKYRKQFLEIFKTNRVAMIGLNALNEIVNAIATLSFHFAILLAPLALVQTVNGFQPVFVFIYGIILTLLIPRLGAESLVKKQLIQKIASIAVMVIGTVLINRVM